MGLIFFYVNNLIAESLESLLLLLFVGGFLTFLVYVLWRQYRESIPVDEGLPTPHCYWQIKNWYGRAPKGKNRTLFMFCVRYYNLRENPS